MEICQIIVNGCSRDFLTYLENGLDPNHCICENIYIKDVLFTKGSPLIFLLIHYSTVSIYFWDSLAMIRLLLERGVDVGKQFEYGGGYTNVLDYACENENLIFEDILICLLKSVDSKSIYSALNKIKNSKRREDIKEKLFPDFFSEREFELLHSTSVSFLEESEVNLFFLNSSFVFNEEELCQSLVNGNHKKLRNFLDNGISSNYIISCNIKVKDFVCKKGLSLLLITLVYCVEKNVSWILFEIISLLLEKGVDLQQECCGINPLDYLCENEQFFLEDIVFCLLTSVSKEEAFKALNKVANIERREYLKKNIDSKNLLFQFENAQESTHGVDESIVVCKNPQNILLNSSCDAFIPDALANDSNFSLNFIESNFQDKVHEISLKILNNDFSELEKLLKNSLISKEYGEKVKSVDGEGETFFSRLMSEIIDPKLRHKICYLCLQYGFSAKTVVYKDINLLNFLCKLRSSYISVRADKYLLLQTICLVLFLSKKDNLVELDISNSIDSEERLKLIDFFINKNIKNFKEFDEQKTFDFREESSFERNKRMKLFK